MQPLPECKAEIPDCKAELVINIDALLPAESPRLEGEQPEQIQALAETDSQLPPILVNRPTMRVIDGMHRLRAAQLKGRKTIGVRFFDASEEEAFILAVQLNVEHGMPLTRADREAAALRIVMIRPQWSDRAIAAVAGLSAKTVGAIRRRSTEEFPQSNARLGRDGRVRPLAVADGRRRAAEVLGRRPDASVRQIAKIAGVSLGTAHDVRNRVERGIDPVPQHRRTPRGGGKRDTRLRQRTDEPVRLTSPRERLRSLQRDPALRFTEDGRTILRWLDARVTASDEWTTLVDKMPPHSAYLVAELAMECAAAWREFAEVLRMRVQAAG